jgi:hypothetical protein
VIDVLFLSPATATSDISTTSERCLEVSGRCIPMLARGLLMHGGCVLRRLLPIKIGFWNPGSSKGGGGVWYGLELWRLAQDLIGSPGREWSYVRVVCTLSPLAQCLCSLARTGRDGLWWTAVLVKLKVPPPTNQCDAPECDLLYMILSVRREGAEPSEDHTVRPAELPAVMRWRPQSTSAVKIE